MSFDLSVVLSVLPELSRGLLTTLQASVTCCVLAISFGAGLATLGGRRSRLVRGLVAGYIDFMRGIPPLVLLLIAFYVLPSFDVVLDSWTTGILSLSLYYAAYIAEVIRGAVMAIPDGQREAALVIGMPQHQVVTRVVLPQALGVMVPPLTGLRIGIVKDTALLSVISVSEFTFMAKQAVSRTYAPFEVYFLVACGYWALTSTIDLSMRRLERRATWYRAAGWKAHTQEAR
jgi:His/Glu/Gln/Arg/opine family amino acid ABC transporter permease subunit